MASGIRRLTAAAEGLPIQVTVRGSGTPVLLLPGATGMPFGYAPLIRLLSRKCGLVTYDRRGHGHSAVEGDEPVSVTDHARDAEAVLTALDEGPVHIVGSSAGALIGLETLIRCPQRVGTVLAHEPPAVPLLDDAERWQTWYADIVEINRALSTRAAFDYFFAHVLSDGTGEQAAIGVPDSQLPEWDVYLRRELTGIVTHPLSPDALRAVREQIVPALGADSRERWHGRVVTELSRMVDRPALEVPGGHLAPTYQPVPFAEAVSRAFAL
ncbi:alpha/beta fold hydrolase [Streptomyces sp. NPDC002067]